MSQPENPRERNDAPEAPPRPHLDELPKDLARELAGGGDDEDEGPRLGELDIDAELASELAGDTAGEPPKVNEDDLDALIRDVEADAPTLGATLQALKQLEESEAQREREQASREAREADEAEPEIDESDREVSFVAVDGPLEEPAFRVARPNTLASIAEEVEQLDGILQQADTELPQDEADASDEASDAADDAVASAPSDIPSSEPESEAQTAPEAEPEPETEARIPSIEEVQNQQPDAPMDEAAEPSDQVAPDEASAPGIEERLIRYLLGLGKLSNADLGRARKLASDAGDPLLRMMVRLGLISDRDMAESYSEVMDIPLAAPKDFPDEPVAEDKVSLRFLKDAQAMPLAAGEDSIDVAFADPGDDFVVRSMEMALGKTVLPRAGLASDIESALERVYEKPKEEDEDADPFTADFGDFSEEDIEHLKDLASEAPVIRLVNTIMQRAVEQRASDIHIEPFADELKVRYRVDGILKEVDSPPVRSTAAVISRIKIMSKLNIAERRLPQDGRIPLRVQGKELDLRVSTVPTMFGESVVMRLLDKESVKFDFDTLGFMGSARKRLLSVLDMPYGIFLVTGPTGSGKSTTLYTALSRLNTAERKIITVEDPVEYQLPGINQIQVKASIGMTFSGALRAIVRQDPDIIMVGEMRDLETARIAVQSALTGHVVLSTLHTNDAASGVTRLLDMGVEDYLLTSTIAGILAQRLVRKLCPHCREPYQPSDELSARFLDILPHGTTPTLHRPKGCEACNHTGFRGRLVITEILKMSDKIRQSVLAHATANEIQRIAADEGMESMYIDGLHKCAEGLTTVEEILRVAEDV